MSKRLDLNKLRSAMHQLNLEQARQLYAELGAFIQELEQAPSTPELVGTKGREVVETRHLGNHLYQLERVRCGKAGCKCVGKNGELHGPYWYVYWRDDGKLRSRYVGKQFRQLQ
ncbi:MAG: hypothetical protein Kow00121_34510 [Elainellaceae cyanobacterium]